MTTVQDPWRNILILRAPASSGGLGGVFQPAWGTSSMVTGRRQDRVIEGVDLVGGGL